MTEMPLLRYLELAVESNAKSVLVGRGERVEVEALVE